MMLNLNNEVSVSFSDQTRTLFKLVIANSTSLKQQEEFKMHQERL